MTGAREVFICNPVPKFCFSVDAALLPQKNIGHVVLRIRMHVSLFDLVRLSSEVQDYAPGQQTSHIATVRCAGNCVNGTFRRVGRIVHTLQTHYTVFPPS